MTSFTVEASRHELSDLQWDAIGIERSTRAGETLNEHLAEDHPACTGVHTHRGPRANWCPRTRELDREWCGTWERYHYNTMLRLRNSIGEQTVRLARIYGDRPGKNPWKSPITGASVDRDAAKKRAEERLEQRRRQWDEDYGQLAREAAENPPKSITETYARLQAEGVA